MLACAGRSETIGPGTAEAEDRNSRNTIFLDAIRITRK